ncbi:uncharacterized protein PHALS_07608 [Plasmopara halstedii]|uniref:Uncharacterized protein n=1 Tax=Plasmopara halstedii TaxID=4781 RepID=A0A0P1B7M6_PLAHL|nr:uncharacterized protein PHALS_07608 [Plasmopara halstedii]CEG49869.1 hypothetical protein PHALS_07608 [Plasmopara halstedii]|eukprot:XP_024586238.1 hypothetical protein PHALS_07608 [Plasmopara halstedii]
MRPRRHEVTGLDLDGRHTSFYTQTLKLPHEIAMGSGHVDMVDTILVQIAHQKMPHFKQHLG